MNSDSNSNNNNNNNSIILGESEIGLTFRNEIEKEDLKLIEINNDFLTYLNNWKEKNLDQQSSQTIIDSTSSSQSSSPRKKQKTNSTNLDQQQKQQQKQPKQIQTPPIRIRGDSNGDALFCSDSNSFIVKRLETSNSIFLLNSQPNSFNKENAATSSITQPTSLPLIGPVSYTMELSSTRPKLEKLIELLSTTAYAGPEEEEKLLKRLNNNNNNNNDVKMIENSPFGPLKDSQSQQQQQQQQQTKSENSKHKLYSLEQLSYLVPSSEKELKDALLELGAFDLNGIEILFFYSSYFFI